MADDPGRSDGDRGEPPVERAEQADGPVRDLAEWNQIWEQDAAFPIHRRPGLLGGLTVLFKRIARPFVKASTADLWDRQRVFNQILLDHLAEREARLQSLLDEAGQEMEWRTQEMRDQAVLVSRVLREGLQDVMHHNDALFARVDQKLDRYRREVRSLESDATPDVSDPNAGE